MAKNHKKRYEIHERVNPHDEWKKHKAFSDLERAKQSFNACIKNTTNIFKDSMYYKYRLIDTNTNKVIDDTSSDSHIFFY